MRGKLQVSFKNEIQGPITTTRVHVCACNRDDYGNTMLI